MNAFLGTVLPLLLAIGSVVVVLATYFLWSLRRSWGNPPYPPLAKMLRESWKERP